MAEGRKEYVWYPAEDKDEWRLCQLLSRTPGGGTSLRFNQKEKDGLGDDQMEDAIRNQFCNQNPYSNIDEITLCVNPFRYLPIFDETFIDKYASLDANLPPHIFNATARAYQRSMAKKENQVLCLLGDRSSGKSKALEHLLCFLGQTAGDGDEEFKRVLEVLWPFLSISSSLGRHTWLSTRALLEVELGFAADGFICHTQLKVRCLEAHRVAHRGAAKNFDVLYLAAKDDDAAEWLGDSVEFQILGDEIDFEECDESGAARQRWRAAVDAVDGMDHNELVRILCGVILLGQIQFSDSLQCEPAGTLDAASKALGVNYGALLGALLQGAETAEQAAELRDAALEGIYHRLVHLVVGLVTDKMQGEAKAISQSISILEFPSVDPTAPPGFHGLLLQGLSEARFGRILHAARPAGASKLRDSSDDQARAAEDLCEELMKACESHDADVGQVKAWAQAKSQAEGLMHVSGDSVTISGASGAVQHVLNQRFVTAASGNKLSSEMCQVLGQSSCKLCRSVALSKPPSSGTDAAQEGLEALDHSLQGEAKAWLVCCLRPNDVGQADRVNREVMLQQVQDLRLADAVHLSGGHSIIWPLKSFRHRYANLAPTLNDSVSDEDACRLLVKSTAAGEGTVGKDKVYGGEIFEQLMEHKLEELQVGAQHLEGTKSEMRQLMEEKLEADQQMRARQQEEQLENQRLAQEKAQKEIDSIRGQHEDVAKQQQELLQKLQEQQMELQKQQQEQMEALRQQQMLELERLRKQHEDASAAAAAQAVPEPGPASPAPPEEPLETLETEEPAAPAEARAELVIEPIRPSIPSTWRFRAAGEGQSYPAAHAALTQMAALLRVAKEREQCMVEYETFQQETLQDLKAEHEGWRKEAQLLHLQASDLQRSIQDPPPDSTSKGKGDDFEPWWFLTFEPLLVKCLAYFGLTFHQEKMINIWVSWDIMELIADLLWLSLLCSLG